MKRKSNKRIKKNSTPKQYPVEETELLKMLGSFQSALFGLTNEIKDLKYQLKSKSDIGDIGYISKRKPLEFDGIESFTKEKFRTNITLIDLLERYKDYQIGEQDLKPRTIVNYGVYIGNIKKYLQHISDPSILISEIDYQFAEDFKDFFSNRKHNSSENTSRHLELIKRAFEYAIIRGYAPVNPLSSLKAKRDKVKEIMTITEDELKSLANTKFSKKHLQIVADVYRFQCYTGMSYGDLSTFEIINEEGREWIKNNRNKNGKPYYVPLCWEAKEILNKYGGQMPDKLKARNKTNNNNVNMYLRIACDEAGIKKYLTTHTARKTFATRMYEKGFTIDAVADMMGNTVQIATKHYVKKSRKRLEHELLKINF